MYIQKEIECTKNNPLIITSHRNVNLLINIQIKVVNLVWLTYLIDSYICLSFLSFFMYILADYSFFSRRIQREVINTDKRNSECRVCLLINSSWTPLVVIVGVRGSVIMRCVEQSCEIQIVLRLAHSTRKV